MERLSEIPPKGALDLVAAATSAFSIQRFADCREKRGYVRSVWRPRMLAIPQLLGELLAEGRWPRDAAEATAQNLRPLAAPERVQSLAAEESTIYLMPPPFQTIRERSAKEAFWNWPMSDPGGIDPDLALVIGDFGLGSDAPIVLDYREDPANPRVIRLQWAGDARLNRWVVMAQDFQSFIEALGI